MVPGEDRVEQEVLPRVRASRRAFVKGVIATTAFSAPFVTSFDMNHLKLRAAQAQQGNQSNQSNQVSL